MNRNSISRDATIRALRASFEANSRSYERLEQVSREAEIFFTSVSDCVFLFEGSELERVNEEGKKVLEEAGLTRDQILRALLRLGQDHADELPIQMEFRTDQARPLFLQVRNATRFEVEDEQFHLVTAENQTALQALIAESEQISADERRRIGRNLHDGLSQLLTSLSMQVTAQALAENNPSESSEWQEIAALVKSSLRSQASITQKLEKASGG